MSRKALLLKIILPFVIIALGVAGMAGLLMSRQPPPREEVRNPGTLVEVLPARFADHRVQVHATGTVQARREASITPQVSGQVVEMAPDLVVGGLFREGEELFAIEAVDYRLAVERAQAALTRAELELQTIEGQARIARREWERFELSAEREPSPLVLYEPQLQNAKAAVASANAQLEQALIDLRRTRLSAPFDCRISSEQIDIGQYVRAGSAAATVSGTRLAEVVIPLPVEELGRLRIPRAGTDNQGSPALVRLATGERTFLWHGRVARSLGEVDPQGRMARVVVEVTDPYNLRGTWPADQPALEPGMFVQSEIQGNTLKDVAAIPRAALRGDDTVWIAGPDDTLRIAEVEVARREQETLLIRGGLAPQDRVILTPIAGAAEGMKLRVREGGETQ